jgi:hypothetical protein
VAGKPFERLIEIDGADPKNTPRTPISLGAELSPSRPLAALLRKRRMGQAEKPPITVIEPENLETVFITGGHVEAIDTQTVRIVAWVDRPTTNSRKIVARVAAPLSVAIEMNLQMQKAIAQVIGELKHDIEKSHE